MVCIGDPSPAALAFSYMPSSLRLDRPITLRPMSTVAPSPPQLTSPAVARDSTWLVLLKCARLAFSSSGLNTRISGWRGHVRRRPEQLVVEKTRTNSTANRSGASTAASAGQRAWVRSLAVLCFSCELVAYSVNDALSLVPREDRHVIFQRPGIHPTVRGRQV